MNQENKFNNNIKINKEYKVIANSYTHDGNGISRILDEETSFLLFVPGIIKGEEAVVKVNSTRKNYGTAKITKLLLKKSSPKRVTPVCPLFLNCGGCQLMHMNYEAQLEFKENTLKDTLEKIGGLENLPLNKIVGASSPHFYRNKVQVPFQYQKGKTVCGFYQNSSHAVIPFDNCFIQSKEMSDIVKFIRNLCNEFKIKGYDENTKSGDIRHALIKESKATNEIMVVLVTTKKAILNLNELVKKLTSRFSNIVSVIQNINSSDTNTILGEEQHVLYGKSTINDILRGLKFAIGAKSFYQVNHDQTEKMYEKVIELGNFNKNDIVIDAYCGIGTITLNVAPNVAKVYGIEIVNEAIENANLNKELNAITNAEFILGKSEEKIKELLLKGINPNALIVDPPRKGLDRALLDTLIETKIKRIVYVSCDPATLARDLRVLTNKGYFIQSITPFDMFPQTNHVETIVLLEKKPQK